MSQQHHQALMDEVMLALVLKVLEDLDPKLIEQVLSNQNDPKALIPIFQQHNQSAHGRMMARRKSQSAPAPPSKPQRRRSDGRIDHMDGLTAAARAIFEGRK